MIKYLEECFTFSELHVINDLEARGVNDEELLPNYFYRDDSVRLWNCIYRYANDLLCLFYTTNDDVIFDTEIQVSLQK